MIEVQDRVIRSEDMQAFIRPYEVKKFDPYNPENYYIVEFDVEFDKPKIQLKNPEDDASEKIDTGKRSGKLYK